MSASRLRLYAPFIALALVQALVIAVAPSTPKGAADTVALDPVTGEPLPTAGPDGSTPGTPGATPGATLAPGQPGATLGPGGPTGGPVPTSSTGQGTVVVPGPGGGNTVIRGDVSHCTKDGRQHGVVYQSPPCVPKWTKGQQNGGATSMGVTAAEIKIVFFREEKNPVVESLINGEGLSRTTAQENAFNEAAIEFLHKRYELYGRKIKYIYYEADCPETPPRKEQCQAAAREVIRMKPFAVVWPVPIYPDVFDDFYRAKIVALGGWHFANPYFNGRRPYRWDNFMDGSQAADFVSDYYCAKLVGRKASHSGTTIHSSIGDRGEVTRKLGIIIPEHPANVASAKHVAARVKACGGGETPIVTYASDIERAQAQAAANVSALIAAKVTTVICFGEPIAPAFRTATMTEQQYFPEHLLAGQGLLDYDKLGRLYDKQQWQHAFGLSHLNASNQAPFAQSDGPKMWRDVGRDGLPCEACNVPASAWLLLGQMLQQAGPTLTPANVERGMFAMGDRGGWRQNRRADITLATFGQNDYTQISNVREVYWSNTKRSTLDGRPGTYIPMDGGRRYERGEFDRGLRIPVPVA